MRRYLLVFFLLLMSISGISFAQNVVQPPKISNVQVEPVSNTEVRITWETDKEADSLVNYGLQPNYGIVRIPTADRRQHEITLTNLEPGRDYYFRVVSSDREGNQGISADYRISSEQISEDTVGDGQHDTVSEPIEVITEITPVPIQTTERVTTEEIIEHVQEITDVQQLQEILDTVIQAIQGVTDDLTIIGPPTVIPETTTALVSWTTDRASDSTVFFSPAYRYVPNEYIFSQSGTDGMTNEHEIELIGLEPFTEYHFKVRSTDALGVVGESMDFTFTTKGIQPEIRNLRVLKVEENSATLAWDTTVPAQALVEYQDLTTGVRNSIGRPSLATTHQMRISDLTLGTRYVAFVIAENASGDRVRSQPITFITTRDVDPPIISNVTNESTLFPGDGTRIQTIVEWRTDEPAFCIMTYQEGVAGGVEPVTIENEERNYTERHVEVIVNFAPATVYQFWLECEDEAGNSARSEDFVLFTPIQERNIIDLIIENFESTFGWVRNITR